MSILLANKVYRVETLLITVFWWTFKIRQCVGPYFAHEV